MARRKGVRGMAILIVGGLLEGLLSGLEVQAEITDLLEEIYYENLR